MPEVKKMENTWQLFAYWLTLCVLYEGASGEMPQLPTTTENTTPGLGWWSEWGEWGLCIGLCEWGVTHRYRKCPRGYCVGEEAQNTSCDISKYCEEAGWGVWGEYEAYSSCDKACGRGHMTTRRERTCINPDIPKEGQGCPGPTINYSLNACNTHSCYLHGKWADWREWLSAECSTTCGFGLLTKTRLRTCTNPQPSGGGYNCVEDNWETFQIPCKNDVDCEVSTIVTTSVTWPSYVNPTAHITLTVLLGVPGAIGLYFAIRSVRRAYNSNQGADNFSMDIREVDYDWHSKGIPTISKSVDMPNDKIPATRFHVKI